MIAQEQVTAFFLAEKLSPRLEQDVRSIELLPDVQRLAVMPDVHEGPLSPNGLVVATKRLIYPELVGRDIGCGISAIKFQSSGIALEQKYDARLLALFHAAVPTLKQPGNAINSLLDFPNDETGCSDALRHAIHREGQIQLGTLGRGNHFIELDFDREGALWLIVHSGSRAMGQIIHNHHRGSVRRTGLGCSFALSVDCKDGLSYLADADWAIRYARINRMVIINRVADILERRYGMTPIEQSYIDSPHNFVRLESVGGAELIVHRKSVNSAALDEMGIIPGSMSSGCRIVSGKGNVASLCSSSHGAGRRFRRKEAVAKIRTHDFILSMRGIVFDRGKAAVLRDEAPQAYRDIDEVMRAQHDLVRTVAVLKPLLNDKRI